MLVLEAALVILHVQADEAEVRVRPDTAGVGARELSLRQAGIVVEAQFTGVGASAGGDGTWRKGEAQLESFEKVVAGGVEGGVV